MKRLWYMLALCAGPLHADIVLPDGKVIDCYCTDRSGGRVELGQTICLYVDGRAFMARCEMSLNVPIWRETGESCLTSWLDLAPTRPRADQDRPLSSFHKYSRRRRDFLRKIAPLTAGSRPSGRGFPPPHAHPQSPWPRSCHKAG